MILGCAALMVAPSAHAGRRCYSPATAARHPHRKLCVKAHVYREIQLDDGTRVLDVCSPRTAAADCRFAFVTLDRNRSKVGGLEQFIGKEVEVQGKVLPVHGRSEILLSSAKQLHLAASEHHRKEVASTRHSKFHPNPELLKGFNATQSRMPIADPAFRGGYRN
ncbi:MAG: hypothetical protein ACP5M4_04610 [Acidobacteriaceae bacterium]